MCGPVGYIISNFVAIINTHKSQNTAIMKIFRHIALAALLLTSAATAVAQHSTTPYSRLGYGMLGENATGAQRSMGGVGYAMQNSRQINVMNPASYAATDSLTFLWDIGMDLTNVWSTENGKHGYNFGGGLDYITGAFRIAKGLGGSFGVVPFSSVGYSFGSEIDNGSEGRAGSGSISELYVGVGWEPVKNLSVGANVSYMFGTTDNQTYIYSTSTTMFGRTLEVRDWNAHVGLQYGVDLGKRDRVVVGATYSPKKSLHGHTWGTYYDITNDTQADTVGYTSLSGKYELPNTFGAGISYSHGTQFMAEVDFTYQDWKKAKYTTLAGYESEATAFDNRWRVAGGLQYVPNARGSYLKRMTYRLGASYNHDYQTVLGNGVRDYGVSLGFGFPALGSKTMVNLGVEYKHRYTAPTNLIKEDYLNITLSVNFNEMWFWKNKIR